MLVAIAQVLPGGTLDDPGSFSKQMKSEEIQFLLPWKIIDK